MRHSSSDAKTPEIGATIQGNGDLRPRDDSAANAASSVTSSAAQAASSGGGDATSSLLGGTLDASKAAGAEGASSATPNVPVENAQAPSSSTGIPSITTPQDAKPGGSSEVNLPQIGVNGLEGAKAPVGANLDRETNANSFRATDFGTVSSCGFAFGTQQYLCASGDNLPEAQRNLLHKQMALIGNEEQQDRAEKYFVDQIVREIGKKWGYSTAQYFKDINDFGKTVSPQAQKFLNDLVISGWKNNTLFPSQLEDIGKLAQSYLKLHGPTSSGENARRFEIIASELIDAEHNNSVGNAYKDAFSNSFKELSGINDALRALTGNDPDSHSAIGLGERVLALAAIVPFGKYAKGLKLGGILGRSGKEAEAAAAALFKTCRNSFTPDTPVMTSSGLLPIASLLALDGTGNAAASSVTQVWTYNETTGKNELQPVNHVFINEDPAITYLELKNKDGSSEQIITTPEHPFYVQEKAKNTPSSTGYGPRPPASEGGQLLGPNWVGAGHLLKGDKIRMFDGSSGTVVNVLTLAETRTMYNLEVQGNHNFFVGRSSALVHNAKIDNCFKNYVAGLALVNQPIPFRLPSVRVQTGSVNGKAIMTQMDVDLRDVLARVDDPAKRLAGDGKSFLNKDARGQNWLPQKPAGYYQEFTIPTPGASDRGYQRLIVGRDGEYYYTPTHFINIPNETNWYRLR